VMYGDVDYRCLLINEQNAIILMQLTLIVGNNVTLHAILLVQIKIWCFKNEYYFLNMFASKSIEQMRFGHFSPDTRFTIYNFCSSIRISIFYICLFNWGSRHTNTV
jgi:hypothetical protein